MTATFLRLLNADDKAATLAQVVSNANSGITSSFIFHVDIKALAQVPGSPFAYWVSDPSLEIFKQSTSLVDNDYSVRQGLATADDPRFVRLWWEINPSKIVADSTNVFLKLNEDKWWLAFAKGGSFSPYYADLHLVVNWHNNGHEIKIRVNPETGKTYSNVWQLAGTEREYFYRLGITWPRRTNGLSFRLLPSGSIFGDKGPALFHETDDPHKLTALCGVLNSKAFSSLLSLQLGRVSLAQSFEVGLVSQTPLPIYKYDELEMRVHQTYDLKRDLERANEISHVFHVSAILQTPGITLTERIETWKYRLAAVQAQLESNQLEIDSIVLKLYGLTEKDIELPEDAERKIQKLDAISEIENDSLPIIGTSDVDDESEEDADDLGNTADTTIQAASLISYLVGCAFGRWDIRFATGEKPTPALPDPFAPLPACSPGMLIGEDGLPLKAPPAGYPLAVDADGILSDDPTHTDDIVKRVREGLDVIFGDAAERWEHDLCNALGVSELRDYLRKGAFWNAHIKRYSKSRRKAPIYWLLQSPKKHYGLWLYLHRLDRDTLFKALVKYAEPKLRGEEIALEQLAAQRAAASTPREQRQADRDLERQHAVIADVREFCERLRRAADLGLTPDLNDGVVLTIAPLRELVPWKDAARYWDELRAGKYPWSSIAQQMREKGLLKA